MNEDLKKALEVLKNGGVLLYPTDTIWGIGCDATNSQAVSRIYQIKQREDAKSMIVLMHSEQMLTAYIDEVPEVAWDLLDAAVEPLTIIYPGAKNLAANVVHADKTVGIRIATDEFCQTLIRQFKKPIVSTSANISGAPAPGNFSEIDPEVINQVDYVVEWRQDDYTKYKPSSIIKLDVGGKVEIIRE